jgi:lysophospholipase L1-like esterase
MSVQVSYKKQAILGLMFLLVILSAVEVIGRIVLEERDSCNQSLPMSGLYEHLTINDLKKICQDYYHNIIQYPLPIIHYEPNQKTDTVTINSHGFRGEELGQGKMDDEEYRIFVLGGSALYGIFATSDNTTIPGYLQEFYNEFTTDRDVRVINAGVNGHESFAETYIMKNKIIDLDPDLIIVFDGWNDLGAPLEREYKEPTGIEQLEQYSLVIRKYYKTIVFYEFIERVWEKQFGKIEFFDRFDRWERETNDDVTANQKSELWKSRWKEICELGEKENFKVIITLQPIVGAGNKVLADWELRHVEQAAGYAASYNFMRDKLNELETSCTGIEDFTNIFDNETGLMYFDYAHMGDAGNRIVAEKMFKISLPFVTDIQE